ncbi:MAG: anthranilate synthase component I family protein [Gemmatimonadota bacterium]
MIAARPTPDLERFKELARPGHLVPVFLSFPFDIDTAVSAFAKLRRAPFGFLLESVEGGERWARFTFLGSEPREAWKVEEDRVSRWTPADGWSEEGRTKDPFADFQKWVGRHEPVRVEGLPRFWGGAVGYFGYDMVRWLEHLPDPPAPDPALPDAWFVATDRMLILDNLLSRAMAVRAVPIPDDGDLEALYRDAVVSLQEWTRRLERPSGLNPLVLAEEPGAEKELDVESNRTREEFERAVECVREHIARGDTYQVVISQRLEAGLPGDTLAVYRALRMLNPSPYLFYLELEGLRLIGSSPESLVRVEEDQVTVRPIAGTRARGSGPAEDEALARELRSDEKERAEHLMLVDLGRNDVSRVAEAGSVRVPKFMQIERYSHVMHLVSEVVGALASNRSATDALRACFPAGTLTGAPKVRAMEIIDELETVRRGPYGGAAGYVAYGGRNLDMAIIIRTIVGWGKRAYAQAGAGIVHDSIAGHEWEETRNKARVLLRALAQVR